MHVAADSTEADIEAQVFDQMTAAGVPSEVAADMAQSVADNLIRARDEAEAEAGEPWIPPEMAALSAEGKAALAAMKTARAAYQRARRWTWIAFGACCVGALAGTVHLTLWLLKAFT